MLDAAEVDCPGCRLLAESAAVAGIGVAQLAERLAGHAVGVFLSPRTAGDTPMAAPGIYLSRAGGNMPSRHWNWP